MDSDTELFSLVMAELREHHLLSAAQLHATMRQKFPEKQIPSTGRFRLWLTKWKQTHPQDWERLKNPRRLVSRFMPAFGNKDDEVTRPGQIVEIDISPCDLLCLDGRHYLIVAIDVHTRRCGWDDRSESFGRRSTGLPAKVLPDDLRAGNGPGQSRGKNLGRIGSERLRQPRNRHRFRCAVFRLVKTLRRARHRHYPDKFPDAAGCHRRKCC